MHKAPSQIARSLRAFRNAHRLGLLRSVRISPGAHACEAARSQQGIEYMGDIVPRLPLAECTRGLCNCKYAPLGSSRMHRLIASDKPRPSKPHNILSIVPLQSARLDPYYSRRGTLM